MRRVPTPSALTALVGACLLLAASAATVPATAGTVPTVSLEDLGLDTKPSKAQYIVLDTARKVGELRRQDVSGEEIARRLTNDVVHVRRDGSIELELWSPAPVPDSSLVALRELGARIVTNFAPPPRLRLGPVGIVQTWVPYDKIERAAALPWVSVATPATYGISNAVGFGSIISEGVARHNADTVQEPRGLTGAGVTVGAMSDGVENLQEAVDAGELPNDVTVQDVGNNDEGTAMLEIVADVAPGADLVFNGVGGGMAGYVDSLNQLSTASHVVTHDIALDAEPAFQEGIAAQTADNIAALGDSFHSSSGNRGNNHAARMPANGTGQTPDGTSNTFTGCTNTPDNVVAIAPGGDTTFDVTLADPASFTLQWSEPRAIFPTIGQGGFTDLNLYIMNQSLTQCLGESVGVQGAGMGDTIERVAISGMGGTPVKIVVDVQGATGAASVPLLDLRWRGANPVDQATAAGSLDPNENMTGLAAAVGAVLATDNSLRGFSSQGPVTLATTTQCPGGAAGPCVGVPGPAAQIFQQPFWMGADGVSVSGAGTFPTNFSGTSASAPHTAACDALLRSSALFDPTSAPADTNARLAATAFGPANPNVLGAGTLDCLAAVNRPPVADAGGPYAAIEGQSITLDGVSSSDPDAGDVLTYAWDLNNNGSFETAGATVNFVSGQDGSFTVGLQVTDGGGLTATDTVTVDVTNVAPTVTINPAAPVHEKSSLSITGSITDPGWEDNLTATIDFDDGAGPQALSGTYTSTPQGLARLNFSVDHVYGDNGTFDVEVCGSDDDATTCHSSLFDVTNVSPVATITAPPNGYVAHAGETVHLVGRAQDPGSDDLTLRWQWDDGSPDATGASLVNALFDPPKSPSIQPRDVTDPRDHVFGDACLYEVAFSLGDDDGGAGSDDITVVITGNATKTRSQGYWQHQFGGQGNTSFSGAELTCYLAITDFMSGVFNEVRDASTRAAAFDVLHPAGTSQPQKQFDRSLLTAWLNFANGALALSDSISTAGGSLTFADAVTAAEATRQDPSATKAQLDHHRSILDRFN
jgi:hypothetical protein